METHKSQPIEMDKNEIEMFLYRKTNAKNRNFKKHTILYYFILFFLFFWAGLYLIKKTKTNIEKPIQAFAKIKAKETANSKIIKAVMIPPITKNIKKRKKANVISQIVNNINLDIDYSAGIAYINDYSNYTNLIEINPIEKYNNINTIITN